LAPDATLNVVLVKPKVPPMIALAIAADVPERVWPARRSTTVMPAAVSCVRTAALTTASPPTM
jgi:hypothetical protein